MFSSWGRVYSKRNKRILSTKRTGNKLYPRFEAYGKSVNVHRIICELFVENPNNLPQVNHIDGNKSNNNATNLEWCTQSMNMKHSVFELGNTPQKPPIKKIKKVTQEELDYILNSNKKNSELAKMFNVSIQLISYYKKNKK